MTLLAVFLLVGRLPSVLYTTQLNTDESQLLAQGLTLAQDPRYWESVDGTTTGPIASYLLTWPSLLGLESTFAKARLTGLLLIVLSLFFFHKALSVQFKWPFQQIGLLLITAFFAFATHFDLTHYSSELVVLPLVTLVWWQLVSVINQSTYRRWTHWLWVGFLAGLTPYAKLQGVPVVALLSLGLLLQLMRQNAGRTQNRLAAVGLVLGGFLPTLLVVGYCLTNGILDRFWTFYVQANLVSYHELQYQFGPPLHQSLLKKIGFLPHFVWVESTIRLLCLLSIASVGALIFSRHRLRPTAPHRHWVMLTCWILVSFYVAITPGTQFHHHLLFIIFPLVWLVTAACATVVSIHWIRPVVGLFFVVQVTTLVPMWLASKAPFVCNPYLLSILRKTVNKPSEIGQYLRLHAQKGDQLAVWGWNTTYYVEAQLTQGVSENHSFRSAVPHSLQGAYLTKYMADLRANRPVWIVDAAGPASFLMKDRSRFSVDQFAPLSAYIHGKYQLHSIVDAQAIYLRADQQRTGRQFIADLRILLR